MTDIIAPTHTPTRPQGAWAKTARNRLPAPLTPASRPTDEMLQKLRGRIEHGCPFDLARRAVGIPPDVHEAWLERGLAQHDAQPDRTYRPDGGVTLAGSLEPEAEYVRIFSVVQDGVAADLVSEVFSIAKDKGRKRDQLTAIQMLLRGMGERVFDPRAEVDTTVTTRDERPAVDQDAIDAMTPDERRALVARARAVAGELAAAEADIEVVKKRAAAGPVVAPSTEPPAVTE